jgi:hypothetical protein
MTLMSVNAGDQLVEDLLRGPAQQVLARRHGTSTCDLIEHRPWDNPEIAALPLVAGSPGYLDRLRRTTTAGQCAVAQIAIR